MSREKRGKHLFYPPLFWIDKEFLMRTHFFFFCSLLLSTSSFLFKQKTSLFFPPLSNPFFPSSFPSPNCFRLGNPALGTLDIVPQVFFFVPSFVPRSSVAQDRNRKAARYPGNLSQHHEGSDSDNRFFCLPHAQRRRKKRVSFSGGNNIRALFSFLCSVPDPPLNA